MYIDLFPIYAYKHIGVIVFTTAFLTYDQRHSSYRSIDRSNLRFDASHDYNHTYEIIYKFYNRPEDDRRLEEISKRKRKEKQSTITFRIVAAFSTS